MIFYIDTEFDGFGGELLSLALVPDDHQCRAFYWEIDDVDKAVTNEWVKENVVPVMDKSPKQLLEFNNNKNISQSLQAYFDNFNSAHIIADWPDDIKYFCESLITGPGKRIVTPRLSFEIRYVDSYPCDVVDDDYRHNAYWDAIALRYICQSKTSN